MYEHEHESQNDDNFYDCAKQYNSSKGQQQPYIKSAIDLYSRKSFLPSYEVKYELSLLREKLLLEKEKLAQEFKQQQILQETIGEEQLGLYDAKKRQSSEYRMAMGVVSRVKGIYQIIQQQLKYKVLLESNHEQDNQHKKAQQHLQQQQQQLQLDKSQSPSQQSTQQHLSHEQHAFTYLIQAIEQSNTFYVQQHEAMRELSNNNSNRNNKTIIGSSSDKQKEQFLNNLYKAITEAVKQKRNKDKKPLHDQLQRILKKYDLPVRRNQEPKHRDSRTPKMQSHDRQLLQRLLHWQSCEYALHAYLSSSSTSTTLSPSTVSKSKQVTQPKPKQQLLSKQQSQSQSQFFNLYYEKLQSSISYLFIEDHYSHSFLQPNWMFQYIQEVFVPNYQWLRDNVLVGLKQQTEGNILVYVFQYALDKLFYHNIKQRLQSDLSSPDFLSNPIHSYKYHSIITKHRFIDSLYSLQQKLNITFSQHLTLVQNILIEFQLIQPQKHLLQKCFDYQHKWIQEKIFKDFWENINYSNIDLKNIETYNIVVNFNVLFEKLYTKFSTIYDTQLVSVINTFYQSQIRNLVAHIKTSLQRIYYHSGLDRLSVILAFKRVDNQFRSGLGQFICSDLAFQKQVKKQYYDYLIALFNQLSVDLLAVYSRKLLKSVTELQHMFNAEEVVSEQDRQLLRTKSQHIFKKWALRIQQLNLVYTVKDNKIKNQFFVLLQSINFNQKGIMLFLEFYEPFLKMIYGVQQFNVLKMVILMDKKQQLEFLKVNASSGGTGGQLTFLLESQYKAIKKMSLK